MRVRHVLSWAGPQGAEKLEREMSSTGDKVKGMANQAAGAVKETAGKVVGNEKLEAEGMAQKGVGKAQEAVGKGKDAVKGVVDRA